MNHKIDPKSGDRQITYYDNHRSEDGFYWYEWAVYFLILTTVGLFFGILAINILIWIFTLWINIIGWLMHFFGS